MKAHLTNKRELVIQPENPAEVLALSWLIEDSEERGKPYCFILIDMSDSITANNLVEDGYELGKEVKTLKGA